jgi:hypothetical protein
MIFLKPACNYHQYASFLVFDNPVAAHNCFGEIPFVISRSLDCGEWNILLISEESMDYTTFRDFRRCLFEGKKSVTHLSSVTCLDWDTSMERIYGRLSSPEGKTRLYEEVTENPWKKEGWTLYDTFRDNMRIPVVPALRACNIHYEHYKKWVTHLLQYACISTAFYPAGLDEYFLIDFLFCSLYQKQLTDILGMLPATSIFFSVGDYVLARLPFLDSKEQNDLLALIFTLENEGFFTDSWQAMVISTSKKDAMLTEAHSRKGNDIYR